ncbi:MAG: class 1 fructose-bisphosphatase [Nanoarchaeota archaeon]
MTKVSLREHLKKEGINAHLAKLIALMADFSKPISRAFLTQRKLLQTKNMHGEQQQALDVYADQLIIEELKKSRLVKTIASEEQDDLIEVIKPEGEYGITLDPLDGSSLLDVNLTVGTIVGFFDEGNVMEPGSKMDAAMYILYGPVCTLVYTAKNGVHEFFLDNDDTFYLAEEHIRMPEGKVLGPGGLRKDWLPWHRRFINDLEAADFKVRYSGCMAADFHQVLHKGGLFCYPALKDRPKGKIRLIVESNPLGLIAKEAGGACSDGTRSVHGIRPSSLGHRTPIYIGNRSIIEKMESCKKTEGEYYDH